MAGIKIKKIAAILSGGYAGAIRMIMKTILTACCLIIAFIMVVKLVYEAMKKDFGKIGDVYDIIKMVPK